MPGGTKLCVLLLQLLEDAVFRHDAGVTWAGMLVRAWHKKYVMHDLEELDVIGMAQGPISDYILKSSTIM